MPMRDTTRLLANNNQQQTDTLAIPSKTNTSTPSELSSALSVESNQMMQWPNRRKMEQLKKERCKTNTCQILWVFLGIFLIIGSVQILWAPEYLDNIVHDGIREAFVFTEPLPDDPNYQSWLSNDNGDSSVPIKVYLQFFNVTNAEDVYNGELPIAKRIPQFELTPPIVYTQYYYRENVSFSEDGTMSRSYFKTRFYHDPVLSELSETDVVTIFAPLVAGGRNYFETNNKPLDPLNSFLFNGFFSWLDSDPFNVFSRSTARDAIFDVLRFKYPQNDTTFLGQDIPAGSVIDYTYGLLKNGSGSWYVSHTGYGDEQRMGEVLRWSNQPQDYKYTANDPVLINFDDQNFTYIDCWYPHQPYSPSHFIYQGVWAVKESTDNLPPFFVSTLKKALLFDYTGPVDYKGIPAEQYNVSTGRQFMNESQYPPNAQFQQFGPSGVFNMTSCFSGLPLFFSLPKFMGAPDYMANNSLMNIPMPSGLNDNGFLMVEPMTGALINANVALQGNVPIDPIPEYGANISDSDPSLTHLPEGLMAPTYLLRYQAHLPDDGAEELAARIALANNLDHGFYYFAYICMGLLLVWLSYTMYWFGKNGVKKLFPGLCCAMKAQVRDSTLWQTTK